MMRLFHEFVLYLQVYSGLHRGYIVYYEALCVII